MNTYSEHTALSHCIPATAHDADLVRAEHEVLVAHEFGHGCNNFRCKTTGYFFEHGTGRRVIENPFPEFTDGEPAQTLERGLIMRFKNELADFIQDGINERMVHNLLKGQICENGLRCDALALRARGDHCKLITCLFFVSPGKNLAKIGESESFTVDHARQICMGIFLWCESRPYTISNRLRRSSDLLVTLSLADNLAIKPSQTVGLKIHIESLARAL